MKQGAIAILPLAAGAAVYGFAFGLLAAQVGIPWWGVALMSAAVHAGSSQIVAVEQLSSSGLVLGAVLAGAALNLRYIGIAASLSDMLSGLSLRMKILAVHVAGDENWALTMAARARDPKVGAGFLIGSGLVMVSVWTGSTTLGALAGAALPDLDRFGLGFAFTAAFIAMARGLWRGRRDLLPWGGAFVASVASVQLAVPPAYAIVIGACAGVMLAAARRRRAEVAA